MKLRKPFCGIAALALLAAGAFSVQAAVETPGVVIERNGASWVEFAPEWGEPPARDGFDAALLRQARAAQTEEGRAFRREVEVVRLLDEEGRLVRMCTVFRYGDAVYQLYAWSDGCSVPDGEGKYRPSDGVPEERFLRVLDSLEATG